MKKWFVLAMLVCVAASVQAAESGQTGAAKGKKTDMTKEQFIANQKKMAEKKGDEFDQAQAEATFAKLDINKDGKLSAEEQAKGNKKDKPKKIKTSEEEGDSDSDE